jgi:hypothetical protein
MTNQDGEVACASRQNLRPLCPAFKAQGNVGGGSIRSEEINKQGWTAIVRIKAKLWQAELSFSI